MKRFGIAAIALTAALSLACNRNTLDRTTNTNDTGAGAVGTSGNTNVSSADKNWVEDMLADGSAEVELGKMAADRATNPEVKQFAQRMVRDHEKAGAELKQIASTHSITVNTAPSMDSKHHDLMDKLSKARGADFDRQYMDAMVNDHQDAVSDLEKHADVDRYGKNKGAVTPEKSGNPAEAALNQWAANTLPVVKEHLDMAKQIQDHLKGRNTTY